MKKTIVGILVILSLIIGVSCEDIDHNSGNFEVHVIDIGQGDSILLKSPEGKTSLIDTGSFKNYDKLKAYLLYQGIKTIDKVIATHPDSDHIGSMAELIDDFGVGEFYMPNKEHTTQSYKLMVEALEQHNVPVIKSFKDSTFILSDQIRGYFLSPHDQYYDENNLYSLVLYLEHGSNSFLFMGDAELENEYDILRDYPLLQADFIKIGHHGSNSSSSKEFIYGINPYIAALSVGANNSFGHPHKEVVELLREKEIKLYRTDEQGSLVFISDGNNIYSNQKNTASYSFGQ